jgi:uncharacterized coiled-coil protein SlyX
LAAALFATLPLGQAVRAQSLSAEEVRDCLCREQALQGLRQEVAEKRAAYDAAHDRLNALQRDIDQTRTSMNPNDSIQVQLLAEQIERRDALRTAIQQNEYPALQGPITRLNHAVAEYNQLCADRPMRKIDIEAAQRDLQCPTP